MKKKYQYLVVSLITVISFLIFWEYASLKELVNPIFIGRPSLIFKEFAGLWQSAEFKLLFENSLKALLIGYAISLILGIFIGVLSGLNKTIYAILKPFIFTINATPSLAFIPLAIIWFGIAGPSKVFIIVLFSIIPIIVNTIEGTRAVSPKLIQMSQSFSASRFFIVKNIVIYENIPYIIAGARSALGKAFIGLIIAEFYGLGLGLGYLMAFYGNTYKINKFFAVLAVIVITNFVLLYVLKIIERKVSLWKEESSL